MTNIAPLGVVVDVDGLLRVGTPRRQWHRLRGLLRHSPRDRRSVFGMPRLVRALAPDSDAVPVYYVTAVPGVLSRRVARLLGRDGFLQGHLLTACGAVAPWGLFGGGGAGKRAALERLLAVGRWRGGCWSGTTAGIDPELFAALVRRAPGRVAAVGMRQTVGPDEALPEVGAAARVSGVPVVLAPNGEELQPRTALELKQPRATGVQDWFLGGAERGNDASPLRAWTEGNAARPLVDGSTYHRVFAAVMAGVGVGDTVLFGGWRGDADELLGPAGPTVGEALSGAAVRGALVRGLLWRSHPSALGYHLEPNLGLARTLAVAGAEVLLDQRVRALGCHHHQKFVVVRHVRRPGDDVAFVGGIDLDRGGRDDAEHAGDPQPAAVSTQYGDTPAQHDVQVELRGPVVGEVDTVFRERWEDPSSLSRLPWQVLYDRARGLRRSGSPLPAMPPAPPRAGSCAVQVLRTHPVRRPRSPYAPLGERSIARAYAKALGRAQRLIYLEDQYLWSVDVARLFAAALRRAPDLQLIAVVPRYPDVEDRTCLESARLGHGEALAMVHEAGGERVQIFDIENRRGLPIYVHAKLTVVDDVWAAVGSANLNVRSWTHDSELTVAVLDTERDTRPPGDPAGLGDGARRFARNLRLDLMREHLDLGADDAADRLLLDPARAAQTVRVSAAALDGWYAGGSRGPRPSGRLRPHVLSAAVNDPQPGTAG